MSKKLTTKEFIKKARAVHGDLYSYDTVEYEGSKTKVKIDCKIHGEFLQQPNLHINRTHGCPKCGLINRKNLIKTLSEFLHEAKLMYGDRFNYSEMQYVNATTKVKIICKIHGPTLQEPHQHLRAKNGCLKCSVVSRADKRRYTKDKFIQKAKLMHGNKYNYADSEYKDSRTKINIECTKHGTFRQIAGDHMEGSNCPKCVKEIAAKSLVMTKEQFILKATAKHNNVYTYDNVIYSGNKNKVSITCLKHNDFLQRPNDHLTGNGCPKCIEKVSKLEKQVANFIVSLGFSIERSNRSLFKGTKKEADIYIPKLNMIIEFNGSFFHSEYKRPDIYNIRIKSDLAKTNGLRCIHIREDQWLEQKELVKSLLKSQLGIFDRRIGARKTVKKDISNNEYKELCSHHLQGFRGASVKKGLYYNGELVACIGYNKLGELIRYVVKNGWQILGALPKLIKDEDITFSFCDLSFFGGASYLKAGFKLDYITKPNYRYTKGKKTVSRQSMMN